MFELICILLCILDGIIVAKLLSLLAKKVFGENPVGRLINVIALITGFMGYSFFSINYIMGDEGSIQMAALIVLGPIGAVLLTALITYIIKGNQSE